MKIFIVECDAEELRANRTVLDTLTDVLSNFAETLCGANISKEAVAAYLATRDEEEEETDDAERD